MPESPCQEIKLELGERSYKINVGSGLTNDIGRYVSDLSQKKRVFVVTDENVYRKHFTALKGNFKKCEKEVIPYCVPAGEQSKSFENLEHLLNHLLTHHAERSDLLVAFGGGIIGDLTGLAASLLKRGMKFLQIPTTLLAQVDSSVGGKTAINTKFGKNLIGTFYQPQCVIIDTDYLTTLPRRQILAGYAEIIKYGLIYDSGFHEWLDSCATDIISLKDKEVLVAAISRSCEIKATIVQADEREGSLRQILNFGHTFGHALEAENHYRDSLLHGEAVGCGMALATRYSHRLDMISKTSAESVINSLESAGLKTCISELEGGPYKADGLVAKMMQDKKTKEGKTPLILLNEVGEAHIRSDVDLSDVQEFLSKEVNR